MEAGQANTLWSKFASLSAGDVLALLAVIATAAGAWSSIRQRRRGSVKPIGYFSYLTHGGTVSVCAECGATISDRERRYCLSNPRRFGGMVYCRRHQRRL
jgi:hypothetical protein